MNGTANFVDSVLTGEHGDALNGDSMRIEGDLLAHGVEAVGTVRISHSRVAGRVHFGGSALHAQGHIALEAEQAQIGGDLQLQHAHVEGRIQMALAGISGDLILVSSWIRSASEVAIAADRVKISGRLIAAGLVCFGGIRASGATLDGQLLLAGSSLYGIPHALALDGAQVSSDIMAERLETNGEVRMHGAHIGGQLVLKAAVLRNRDAVALNLDSVQIDEELLLGQGFATDGSIWLTGASIDSIIMTGARVRNPGALAISADFLKLRGSLVMTHGTTISGQIRLVDASVSGQVALEGARLDNPDDVSLLADGLRATNVRLGQNFVSRGSVRLVGARVASQFSLKGSTFERPGEHSAIEAESIDVGGTLFWAPRRMEGVASFAFSRIAIWSDAPRSIRFPCRLLGAKFGQLSAGPGRISIAERIKWLRSDPSGYTPASFKHLAERMRDGGHDREARQLLIVSEHLRRVQSGSRWSRPLRYLGSLIMRWTVAYGYRPLLAVVWLAALIALASFGLTRLPHGPTAHFQELQGAPAPFNALYYSLDSVLPFIDLGYSRWVPQGSAQVITVCLVLLGWALATAVVTALAGLFRRAD
ncbi:hypothetical protein EBM89_03850 [Cellulomonas triticagri]|uniref:Oxidoreductase n=1 Tax=Cellulomonas triticagri TaxID=2483352 RepID=A0A3M2JKB3_9CELL|nr:hypothetical protein EBM89_03850 [Cellulomonas triticagri]